MNTMFEIENLTIVFLIWRRLNLKFYVLTWGKKFEMVNRCCFPSKTDSWRRIETRLTVEM